MSEKELARVRDMFDVIGSTNQSDMRKRACDVIKRYANDPLFIDERPALLTILTEVSLLSIDGVK